VRRRRNHGLRIPAAELAERALKSIVPADRLRALKVRLAWGDAVPAHLVKVAVPVAFDGTVLVIHAIDNQWLHELTYLRGELLARLREHLPGTEITALKIRVGQLPEPLAVPEIPPTFKSVVLPMQPAPDTVAAIADVEDAELRRAVATARQALTSLPRSR
jgi:hypothetical protein